MRTLMEAAEQLTQESKGCSCACCSETETTTEDCACGPECTGCDCNANESIDEVADNFDLTPQQRKLANLGRVLMDLATTTKDDALANTMAKVGNELTNFGALFGPKNVDELIKKTGASKLIIQKLLAHAQAVTDHKAALANDHEDGGLDDTDTDTDTDSEFDNNDNDDGRAADAYARGK